MFFEFCCLRKYEGSSYNFKLDLVNEIPENCLVTLTWPIQVWSV